MVGWRCGASFLFCLGVLYAGLRGSVTAMRSLVDSGVMQVRRGHPATEFHTVYEYRKGCQPPGSRIRDFPKSLRCIGFAASAVAEAERDGPRCLCEADFVFSDNQDENVSPKIFPWRSALPHLKRQRATGWCARWHDGTRLAPERRRSGFWTSSRPSRASTASTQCAFCARAPPGAGRKEGRAGASTTTRSATRWLHGQRDQRLPQPRCRLRSEPRVAHGPHHRRRDLCCQAVQTPR